MKDLLIFIALFVGSIVSGVVYQKIRRIFR